MSKINLRARPILHNTREAIEPHLTDVFTASAVARSRQEATGTSSKKINTTLRPLHDFVGEIDGHKLVFPPTDTELVSSLKIFGPRAGH